MCQAAGESLWGSVGDRGEAEGACIVVEERDKDTIPFLKSNKSRVTRGKFAV